MSIDPGTCRRCGACTGLCPTSSLERSFQPDTEIFGNVVAAVTASVAAPVVVFGCPRTRWNLDDRLLAGAVFVELQSLLVLNETHILQALRAGASGVLLIGCPTCHHDVPDLLRPSLELVRGLVGRDEAVAYIEDDQSQTRDIRIADFIEMAVLSPVRIGRAMVVDGRRREVLAQLLADDLSLDEAAPTVGEWMFADVAVDVGGCVMCGACSRICPTGALGYDPTSGVLDFSHLDCVNCGLCVQACPTDVLTLTPGLKTGDRLLDRMVLKRDEVVSCTRCEQPFIPQRLFEHALAVLDDRAGDLPRAAQQIELCGGCRVIDWDTAPPRNGVANGVGIPLVDRRDFLKGIGVGAAGAALLGLHPSTATAAQPSQIVERKRLAMVIDMDRCIGCHACTAACKAENQVPLGVYRDWVEEHVLGTFPDARPVFLPKLCNHCDDPGCMRACPTGAIFRRADGIVDINHDICIGCRACNQACPYACTFMDPVRGTADKCNFCSHRIDQGLNPACVDVCPTSCRIFGDLDDPDSPPSAYLRDRNPTVLRQELGLGPNVKYVGLPGELNR